LGVKVAPATAWLPEPQTWKLVHCMKVRLAEKALRDALIFYLTYQACLLLERVCTQKAYLYNA